jgi:isoleucyl-tRNA synthetase
MDICKDRLYCDAKDGNERRAAQSVMALIAKSMLGLIAPVLTYTSDEILEYANPILTGGANNIFDFEYSELPSVVSTLDMTLLMNVRNAFLESVDSLKKDKTIKSTLEVELITASSDFGITSKELEDFFMVSAIKENSNNDILASFEIEGKKFDIALATAHKCPRCWRLQSEAEDTLCGRCDEVINV